MTNRESLKAGRNALLRLHKELVDHARTSYEIVNGPLSNADFLLLLLNDSQFQWLRRFSGLLVEIDELLAQKDTPETKAISGLMASLRAIADFELERGEFREKFKAALDDSTRAAHSFAEFKAIVS